MKAGLLTLICCLAATAAVAQKIDPGCAKMRDKVGCTCALQNGGKITPTGGWTSIIHVDVKGGAHQTNEGFVRCNLAHRR
jgi:hypothetical protein